MTGIFNVILVKQFSNRAEAAQKKREGEKGKKDSMVKKICKIAMKWLSNEREKCPIAGSDIEPGYNRCAMHRVSH